MASRSTSEPLLSEIDGNAVGGDDDSGDSADGTMGPTSLDLNLGGTSACGGEGNGDGDKDDRGGRAADFGAYSEAKMKIESAPGP